MGWIEPVEVFIDFNFDMTDDLSFNCFLRKNMELKKNYTIYLDHDGYITEATRNLLSLINMNKYDIKDILYTFHINMFLADFE